jgi:nucleoid-associated protein YgaU
MSDVQEKYQTILETAQQNGTTYELSEGDGVLHIDGTAPSQEAKQQLWDIYNQIDPDYRSGDLVLNIQVSGSENSGGSYTVESGDSLSKIAHKYGITWKEIFDANRDQINDPNMIHPGQELKIPGA